MKLLNKLLCNHDWKVIATTEYADCIVYLLVCNNCGKLVRKVL